jgi:acyl carrier protein phosphodiesterase
MTGLFSNKRNTLVNAQKCKLVVELDKHWDSYIMRENPDFNAAAKYFSNICGFRVTTANMQNIVEAQQSSRPERIWPNRQRKVKVDVTARLNEIANEIESIMAANANKMSQITHLNESIKSNEAIIQQMINEFTKLLK